MMRTKSLSILFAAAAAFVASSAIADTALSSGVPAGLALPGNNLVLNAFMDVDATAKRLTVKVAANGGDFDLFVRYGTPFPTQGLSEDVLNRYGHYHSVSSSSNESVVILPSSRIPLQAGRWYIAVVNASSSTGNGTLTATASAASTLGTIHLDFGNPSADANNPCDDSFWTDSTAAAPVGGNTGTTLGAQRQNALNYAATQLVNQLQIPVDINVHACGAHLGGDKNSAILAHAAPLNYLFDDPQFPLNSLPKKYTWYSITSAVRLGGTDGCRIGGGDCDGLDNDEIEAVFNEDIGSATVVNGEAFYLGFDPSPNPGHSLDFVTIAMHEMTHGLGFFGLVNLDPTAGPLGAKAGISGNSIAFDNLDIGPYDDIYDDYIAIVNSADTAYTPFLGYEVTGANDAARAAALTSGPVVTTDGQYNPGTQTGIRWSDPVAASSSVNINAGKPAPDNFPSLYAPCDMITTTTCVPEPSSTLSHTIQSGDMMNAFYSGFNLRSMGLAVPMLAPLGYSTATAAAPVYGQAIPSNWFDVAHSGHGFDFQIVAHDAQGRDIYFFTFYTYDANGTPEWYQAQGSFVDGVFIADLQSNGQTMYRLVYSNSGLGQIAYQADTTSCPASAPCSVIVDFNQAANSPACRNADRSGIALLGVMSWSIGGTSQQWCVQPLVQNEIHATPDFNGHWLAPADGGWGFELLDTKNSTTSPDINVYVYYPGAAGQPTWATASGKLVNGQATLTLLKISNGYCRTCTPHGLQAANIGTFSLSLTASGTVLSGTASISTIDGSGFNRTNDPIVPLSITATGQ
jgi:hypothetical protein